VQPIFETIAFALHVKVGHGALQQWASLSMLLWWNGEKHWNDPHSVRRNPDTPVLSLLSRSSGTLSSYCSSKAWSVVYFTMQLSV